MHTTVTSKNRFFPGLGVPGVLGVLGVPGVFGVLGGRRRGVTCFAGMVKWNSILASSVMDPRVNSEGDLW